MQSERAEAGHVRPGGLAGGSGGDHCHAAHSRAASAWWRRIMWAILRSTFGRVAL